MTQDITAAQMLGAFKEDAPGHIDGTRWAHTHGIGVLGHFRASSVARNFCVAEHFNGTPVPIIARFSNGSSVPVRHDNWPDTRGLAVKFRYEDGSEHDLLSMTLSVFGARTREQFMELSEAFVPKPIPKPSWFQENVINPLMLRLPPPPMPEGMRISGAPGLAKYAGTHEFARAFTLEGGILQVPASWARAEYHAVHTFIINGPDGVKRPVRFVWQPVSGVFPVPADEAAEKSSSFLTPEIEARLKTAPAQFTLRMSLGDPGDALDDPTSNWPVNRRSVNMGMLIIDKMDGENGEAVDSLSFNPMRLPDGIEASEDEILRARGEIYQIGCGERNGTGCPLMAGKGDGK